MESYYELLIFAALAFTLNVLYRQMQNYFFILNQEPAQWLFFNTLSVFMVWWILSSLNQNDYIGFCAYTVVCFLNYKPLTDKEKLAVDDMYLEIGIKHGRVLSSLGLISLIPLSIASWLILYP